MNEKEFKECSVIAYPHEIRFLHIKGGRISYYVDRHISDYVNKLQEENKQLKEQLQNISNEFLKYDWKTSNKEQIINQLESLYNSIFRE